MTLHDLYEHTVTAKECLCSSVRRILSSCWGDWC